MPSLRKKAIGVAVVLVVIAALGIAFWRFLAPTEPELPRVAFADLVAEVQRGQVLDIHIDGAVYAFRLRGESARTFERKQASGPLADIAQVQALRLSGSEHVAPKIVFEDGKALLGADRKARVAFSEFLDMVEAGRVAEIRVAGRIYAFRVQSDGDRAAERETLGPAALDETQVRALRPRDPSAPAPRVTFDK